MALIQAKSDARIFVDEDYSSSDVSEDFVGRKALSLFHLREIDVPVPPFFAVSPALFSQYITSCLSGGVPSDASDADIREKILNGAFSLTERNEIMEGYSRISGFSQSWVSVRSSIVLPVAFRDVSFAGMLDTVLNVKGLDNLQQAIRKVYASAFTGKVSQYTKQIGLPLSDLKVALVIQKMVQAEASGIVFTIDPISQNPKFLTIEAVFGLGDVIASGEITPDQYVIDKDSFDFIEKRIVPQEWMTVRKVPAKSDQPTEQKVQISKAWQHQQKIENRHIKELAGVAARIEKKIGKPQDIEWVFEGGRIWLLQTMDVTPITLPKFDTQPLEIDPSIISAAQEIALREQAKQAVKQELNQKKKEGMVTPPKPSGPTPDISPVSAAPEPLVGKPINRQIIRSVLQKRSGKSPADRPHPVPLPGEKLLLTGIGASESANRGEAVIIQRPTDVELSKKRLTKDSIMILADHFPEADQYISRVGAVIVDTGGTTSDIATLCRETKTPCVMGCHIASRMLHDGEKLLVDGTIGAVYGIRQAHSQSMQSQESKKQKLPKTKKEKIVPAPEPQKMTGTSTVTVGKKTEGPVVNPDIRTATKIFADISANGKQDTKTAADSLEHADGIACYEADIYFKRANRHPVSLISGGKRAETVKSLARDISEFAEICKGKRLIVSIGSMSSGQYKHLTGGETAETVDDPDYTERTRGLPRLLKQTEELSLLLAAVRRVRNVEGWRHTSIAVRYPTTPNLLSDFKKMLSTNGLRRSSTFNVFVYVDTPSEALILEDFLSVGIDGLLIDLKTLSGHMLSTNETDDSVKKVLESIRGKARELPAIAQLTKNSTELVPFLVKSGFHGISVEPGLVDDVRAKTADIERSLILRRPTDL